MNFKIKRLDDGRLEVSGAKVGVNNQGYLTCSLHPQQQLCDEIKHAIRQGEDYSLLGRLDADLVGTTVMVPLVPIYKLWATVRFSARVEQVEGYRVKLTVPRATPNRDQTADLGIIMPGEGRLVMRSMIYDWFRGSVETEKLRCKSTAHGFRQEQAWNRNTKDEFPEQQLAEWWSCYTSGFCLMCAGALDDFADLVPANQTAS